MMVGVPLTISTLDVVVFVLAPVLEADSERTSRMKKITRVEEGFADVVYLTMKGSGVMVRRVLCKGGGFFQAWG
jgi:hypothetical protein